MFLGLGLSLCSPRQGISGPPPPDAAHLLLDWNVAAATVVSGGVDGIVPAGSMATDANAALAFQFARPVYTASDSDFNGKPSASAVNEARALRTGTFAVPIAQPSTWYIVARVYGGASNMYWRLTAAGSQTSSATLRATGTAIVATSNVAAITGSVTAGVRLLCAIYDGASSAIYIDDMATANVTGNADTNATVSVFTGTYDAQAADVSYKWARHLAFSGSHDQTTRQAVKAYLATLYGLP